MLVTGTPSRTIGCLRSPLMLVLYLLVLAATQLPKLRQHESVIEILPKTVKDEGEQRQDEKKSGAMQHQQTRPPSKVEPIAFPRTNIQRGWLDKPLTSLVQNDTDIVGNDSNYVLDFAILGEAKTATSFLQNTLRKHPDVMMQRKESHFLRKEHGPALLVKDLYHFVRNETEYNATARSRHIGIKDPHSWSVERMQYFQRYFPRTKIVFGLRHPVWWFQSYYNFRVKAGSKMPKATDLIHSKFEGVSVDAARFHEQLALLGRTRFDSAEQKLFNNTTLPITNTTVENEIFMYEMSQVLRPKKNSTSKHVDAECSLRFYDDLQHYLGLPSPIRPFGKNRHKRSLSESSTISICDSEYDGIREKLVKNGKDASRWILQYFLDTENVFVSNRAHFQDLLEAWKTDPCIR